jgi:hypothetical protein
MYRTLTVTAVAATALLAGFAGVAGTAHAGSGVRVAPSTASPFPTFPPPPTFPTFPTPPTFPTFPTPPTFPTFPPAVPAPPPIGRSTNGNRSIVAQLTLGGDDNDGRFDINQFDYHITALLLADVLAANPQGPASILADGPP